MIYREAVTSGNLSETTPHSATPHSATPHSATPHSATPHSATPHSATQPPARVTAPVSAGRPRSERARLAVLEAAADLLVEGGLKAATIEAVAARAGVSKVTIYRWWPTRGAVAIDAYFHRYGQTSSFVDTGDVASDLSAQIRRLIATFRGRAGQVMAELIGQAQSDPVLAETLGSRWLQPRRDATAAVLRRAVERGQIRGDVDIPTLMDQLYAPLYWRLLMRHRPFEDGLAEALVGNLLDGVRLP